MLVKLTPVGVGTEEEIVLVLASVVAVSGCKDVLVQLDHGENGGVEEVLGVSNHVGRIFPHSLEQFNKNVHLEI
jgi:hypothetical protein